MLPIADDVSCSEHRTVTVAAILDESLRYNCIMSARSVCSVTAASMNIQLAIVSFVSKMAEPNNGERVVNFRVDRDCLVQKSPQSDKNYYQAG